MPTIEQIGAVGERVSALPINVVREVIFHFGDTVYGQQPSGFTELMIRAILHADKENRRKLGNEFPELVEAVALAGTGPSWAQDMSHELMRQRAKMRRDKARYGSQAAHALGEALAKAGI